MNALLEMQWLVNSQKIRPLDQLLDQLIKHARCRHVKMSDLDDVTRLGSDYTPQ